MVKMEEPTITTRIFTNFSREVIGTISPYPTVVTVYKVQYVDARY